MFKFIRNIFRKTTKVPDRKEPFLKTKKPLSMEEMYPENADILKGLKFIAVLNPQTPLKYLNYDGTIKTILTQEDSVIPGKFGSFSPQVEDVFKLNISGRTRASYSGPVPEDGGRALPALKEIRAIIESKCEKATSLVAAFDKIKKIENLKYKIITGDECVMFVIEELHGKKIPHLTASHYRKLLSMGILGIQDICTTNEEVLLSLKGIGPKKLESILKH